MRVLSEASSGRGFLQEIRHRLEKSISVENYFTALRSKRRTEIMQQCNRALCVWEDQKELGKDIFASSKSLDDFHIFATDGHCLQHPCHEKRIKGKYRSTNHIFSLNLRNQRLHYVDLCRPEKDKAKQHEITTLKNAASHLRMGVPKGKGEKIIHVYDLAITAYCFWSTLKQNGIYVITREKKNSNPHLTIPLKWNQNNPINEGVLCDEWIASDSSDKKIRRVTYKDPDSQKEYRFLTSLTHNNIEPGWIAFMYKSRWSIEKTFDVSKNKLSEKKGWSKSEDGKIQQALAICLTHNLMILFKLLAKKTERIEDKKVFEKRFARNATSQLPDWIKESLDFLPQISLQFIRWLRVALQHKKPWKIEIPILRDLMERYIT